MSTLLSEKSKVIIRVALKNMSVVLETICDGDQSAMARGKDEINTALNEMGSMTRREEVLFEKYMKEWGLL